MPPKHLLKNKIQPFYGWANGWCLLKVVWVIRALLLIVIVGLRANWGTDARKIFTWKMSRLCLSQLELLCTGDRVVT